MRTRQVLILVAALLLLTLIPAPAGAAEVGASQTPAERAREIATALTKDPLYIDPSYAPGLPETMRAGVREKAKALGYPVYTIILPLSPSDGFQGKERNVLTLVMDALRKPGLYVVVEGGGRFPWYETLDVPQLDEKKLSPARERALDDTEYDAGPTEVLTRFYELLAEPAMRPETDRRTGPANYDHAGRSGGVIALGIVLTLLVCLVALGLRIGLRRRSSGSSGSPRREKPFTIPPHVAATVAAERRRRLTSETSAELTTLGSDPAALPTVAA